MENNKILFVLVFAMLMLGVLMNGASADTADGRILDLKVPSAVKGNNIYLQCFVSPDFREIVRGETVWFKLYLFNNYLDSVAKGTKVSFKLYDSSGKVLRSRTVSIGGLKTSKQVWMWFPYKFKDAGEYELLVETYTKNSFYDLHSFPFVVKHTRCLTC